jgi:hypothetical protein
MRHGAEISGQHLKNSESLKRKTAKMSNDTQGLAAVFTNKETR